MPRQVPARRSKHLQQVPTVPKRSERRERRLAFPIPILVLGFNAGGRIFQEMTMTSNVSQHGCCFHLDQMPDRDSSLAVGVLPREGPVKGNLPHVAYEIAWMREAVSGWELGAKVVGDVGIWELAFLSPLRPQADVIDCT